MEQIRISGKNLGQLALGDFCERCFFLRLKRQNKLPFQIFPGIFSSIDAYSKRITNSHYQKHGRLPKWFKTLGKLGKPIEVPHHSKFSFLDPVTGILLTGAPDEMFQRPDGSLFIVDYKTARLTDHQDKLHGMYAVQLNAYAVITQRIGMGKVGGLALIYYEPKTDVDADAVDAVVEPDGFAMRFKAKILPVELEPDKIPPLLGRVREIYDMPFPPTGRAECKDCGLLAGLVGMLTSPLTVEEQERLREIERELAGLQFEQGIMFERERVLRRERIEIEERLGCPSGPPSG